MSPTALLRVTVFIFFCANTWMPVNGLLTSSSHLTGSTTVQSKTMSEGLSNQRIGFASFDSDNRSLLEQIVAAVNDIRLRQHLQEQERKVGKLVELQQLESLLEQQQFRDKEQEAINSNVVDELKQLQLLVLNNSSEQLRHQRQQWHQLTTLFRDFNETLTSAIDSTADRLRHNVSRGFVQMTLEHTNLLENIKTSLKQLPGFSRILVQQNFNGTMFFNRTWNEFKVGFGDVSGNYWIGNNGLHELTQYGDYKLRVNLKAKNNSQWYWAEYSTFIVDDESTNYTLHIGGYNGTAGDSLNEVNGMQFPTHDRENDMHVTAHCAAGHGGGFWYRKCYHAGLNAKEVGRYGFAWYYLPIGKSADWNDGKKLLVSRLTLLLKLN